MNELWLETYDKMSSSEKNQLVRCMNSLLSRTFLLSETYDDNEKLMKGNSDYRLVDLYFDWVHSYLSIAGWDLIKDRNLGVIYIESSYSYNRLSLNSMTTLILLTIRLLYDEERDKLALRKEISLSTGDVVTRLLSFNALKKKPSDKDLQDALRLLSRYNLIIRISGNWQDAQCQFLVLPSIQLVLEGDAISRIYQSLQNNDEDASDQVSADDGELLPGIEEDV